VSVPNPHPKPRQPRVIDPVPPLAYEIRNSPLPFSRSSWHRWEKAKLIPPLLRIAGKTLIPASTIVGILDRTIQLPKNAGMVKAPVPHDRHRKRKSKSKAAE
jgi:hypothetical protein